MPVKMIACGSLMEVKTIYSERAGKDIGFCTALSVLNAYCSEKLLIIIFLLISLSAVCNSPCTL